jgi:ABC-2 type transport system permease protein
MAILFKTQMQYRTSFWLLSLGQFLVPFTMFAGIWMLFDRFGQLSGWRLAEVALIFAVIHLAFALSECFARGFDTFSGLVVNGGFDRVLVRPRSTVLQVLGSRFEFSRVGRIVQSLLVLGWAIASEPGIWNVPKAVTLVLMVICGVFVFFGIYLLTATLCFWTVEGLEIANILTDGGREMAQYPLNIYEKWVTKLFTFIIPFGCINYVPLLYILGRTEGSGIAYMLTPLAGVLFMIPCLLVWRFGVRHYRSTGS